MTEFVDAAELRAVTGDDGLFTQNRFTHIMQILSGLNLADLIEESNDEL